MSETKRYTCYAVVGPIDVPVRYFETEDEAIDAAHRMSQFDEDCYDVQQETCSKEVYKRRFK